MANPVRYTKLAFYIFTQGYLIVLLGSSSSSLLTSDSTYKDAADPGADG